MLPLARAPAKTVIGGINLLLSPLTPLLSAPWPSRQVQAIIKELFHLKYEAPTGAGGRADLREGSVPCKAFSDELATSDITSYSSWRLPAPPYVKCCLDSRLADFANLSVHSLPMAAAAGPKKQCRIHRPTLYTYMHGTLAPKPNNEFFSSYGHQLITRNVNFIRTIVKAYSIYCKVITNWKYLQIN